MDDAQLIARLSTFHAGFPEGAKAQYFQINRLTGEFEVTFTGEVVAGSPGLGALELILDEHTGKGRCRRGERAF